MFDVFFFCDIVINFISAYEDDNKKVIDDPSKIAIDYLTGWFFIDIIAVVPIGYFM